MSHPLDPHEPKPPGEVLNPPAPPPGEDVDVRTIVRFALGLLVVVAAAALVVFAFIRQLHRFSAEPVPLAAPGQARTVDHEYGTDVTRPDGDVRLQRHPFAEMDERRRRDEELLTRYGWVDREAVRIPIDVAKRLVVQRGLPARAEDTSAAGTPIPVLPVASASPAPRPTPVAPRPTRRPTAPPAEPKPAEGIQ